MGVIVLMRFPQRVGLAMQLDSIDRRLIGALKHDGRKSYAELASSIGVSEGTVRNRLARLVESGVVRIVPVVEPENVGYRLNVWFAIRCQPGTLRDVARSLRGLHPVRYVAISTGAYDVITEAIFLDEAEMLSFLNDDVPTIDGITDIDTSTVLTIEKFGYEWELREEDVVPAGGGRRRRSLRPVPDETEP
jgi:Lrp/AsnC family transcriptional regulator, regulator for asnA, asnC and gidA